MLVFLASFFILFLVFIVLLLYCIIKRSLLHLCHLALPVTNLRTMKYEISSNLVILALFIGFAKVSDLHIVELIANSGKLLINIVEISLVIHVCLSYELDILGEMACKLVLLGVVKQ